MTWADTLKTGGVVLVISDTQAFMLPEIVRMLEQMRRAPSRTPLFQRVENYNRYMDVTKSEKELRQLLGQYTGQQFVPPDLKRVAERLDPDYFLTIRINTLVELIELQFSFYKRFPRSAKNAEPAVSPDAQSSVDARSLPVQNPLLPARSLNVFIDPRRSDYVTELLNALSRLFPETNIAPYAAITLNGIATDSTTVYHIAKDSTLRLDGLESTDPDTPRARFRYRWRQIEPGEPLNVPPGRSLGLDASDSIPAPSLIPRHLGRYRIGLTVTDQVSASREVVVNFEVVPTPTLTVSPSNIVVVRRRSLWGPKIPPEKKYAFLAKVTDTSTAGDSVCLESEAEPASTCFGLDVAPSATRGPYTVRAQSGGLLVTASTRTQSSSRSRRWDITVRPRRNGIQGSSTNVTIQQVSNPMIQLEQQLAFYSVGRHRTAAGKDSVELTSGLTAALQLDWFFYEGFGASVRFSSPMGLRDSLGILHLSTFSPGLVYSETGDRTRTVVRMRAFRASVSDTATGSKQHLFWALGWGVSVNVARQFSVEADFEYFDSLSQRVLSGTTLSLGVTMGWR